VKGVIILETIFQKIKKTGIVPVVKLEDAKDAVPLAKALTDGGLPCVEITFRTAAAEESIRNIVSACPDMLVGAGTVLTLRQLDKAISAGAKFVVSPGFNRTIVMACIEKGVPVYPGCSSPTDMEAALELGLKTVKFFPAENIGGIAAIKAMSGPYGDLTFMPTGGISAKNLNDYLSFGKVIACGGSWMVDPKLIESGDFATITKLACEAVNLMLGYTLAHVGINCEGEPQTYAVAKLFSGLFGVEYKLGDSSVFAGGIVRAMTQIPGCGEKGHIAISTNYIERAMYRLEMQGVKFREDTATKDTDGNIMAIYLDMDINGFAVHLIQK